jgi:hypothetical protein
VLFDLLEQNHKLKDMEHAGAMERQKEEEKNREIENEPQHMPLMKVLKHLPSCSVFLS